MQLIFEMVDGLIRNKEAVDNIKRLENGAYLALIVPLKPKTKKQFQNLYRLKLKSVAFHIGENQPNILHEEFKSSIGLESTASLSEEKWMEFHSNFSEWVFEKFDIYI